MRLPRARAVHLSFNGASQLFRGFAALSHAVDFKYLRDDTLRRAVKAPEEDENRERQHPPAIATACPARGLPHVRRCGVVARPGPARGAIGHSVT